MKVIVFLLISLSIEQGAVMALKVPVQHYVL